MIELTPDALVPLLCDLVRVEPPRAVCLVGAPGMAKTESVRQAAKQLGTAFFVEHPLLREPIDYAGLPWVVQQDGQPARVEQLPMAFVRTVFGAARTEPGKLVIVFFDDVGQVPGSTQAALMQFVQERAFAGQQVPPNVRFVLATNRRRDKAGVGGVLAPLTNRLTVLGVTIDPDAWARWALGSGVTPELVSYVRFKPDCLLDPNEHSNRDLEPFCSARSLEAVSNYLKAGIDSHAVIAGCIGNGRATEVSAFLKTWQELPNVAEVLRKPETAKVYSRQRSDILYALMGSLAARVTPKTMGALAVYLDRLIDAGSVEFAFACAKDAQNAKPELRKTQALLDWLFKHKDVLGVRTDADA